MSLTATLPQRVAIFSDETGWHIQRLKRALQARGWEGRCIDLAECRIDTTWAWHGLVIPGFGRQLPAAAIVRGIAGGSFEQVTKRLSILHALRELGVPVYNDARAIERSVDKAMTSLLLHVAGIPTPATWVSESPAQAQRTLIRENAAGRAVVLKPLFGSQGKGLQKLGAVDGDFVPLPDLSSVDGLAYMQRFVEPQSEPGFDWRVLVVGGKAVTAMRRVSGHWIHNVAQGARCQAESLSAIPTHLAVAATAALGLDYAGVDMIPAPRSAACPDGALVIEVNGVAAWRGLQGVTDFDIAGCIVADLLDRKLAQHATPAARHSRPQ